jgi:regulatory protein
MAVTHPRDRKVKPPLTPEALEQAALAYAGRFATTRVKLADYLRRKLRERGWAGDAAPAIESLVSRMAELGYVNDRAFATARATTLGRRGYGARRVSEALRAAGIKEEDASEAKAAAAAGAWTAAVRFAERRRIGPFAVIEPDRPAREKALAAMLRAGHPLDLARRLISARPGDVPEADG